MNTMRWLSLNQKQIELGTFIEVELEKLVEILTMLIR